MSLIDKIADGFKNFKPLFVGNTQMYIEGKFGDNSLSIGNLTFYKHLDKNYQNPCLVADHHDFEVIISLDTIGTGMYYKDVIFQTVLHNRYYGKGNLPYENIKLMESTDENAVKRIILDVMNATHSRYLEKVLELPNNE